MISITTQLKLHTSLHTVRGHVVQELLQAAADMDVLILGKGGSTASNHIGAVAQRVA